MLSGNWFWDRKLHSEDSLDSGLMRYSCKEMRIAGLNIRSSWPSLHLQLQALLNIIKLCIWDSFYSCANLRPVIGLVRPLFLYISLLLAMSSFWAMKFKDNSPPRADLWVSAVSITRSWSMSAWNLKRGSEWNTTVTKTTGLKYWKDVCVFGVAG